MWSIKEIKQKGKKTLKNNLWTLLLIGLFMTIVVGKYAVNNDSLSNLNVLKQFIEDKILKEKWSPEEVAGYIKVNNIKFEIQPSFQIIYYWIEKGKLNISPLDLVHKAKLEKKEKKEEKTEKKPKHPEKSIHNRPKEIDENKEFGHWELDCVEGSKDSKKTYMTLLERMTKKYIVVEMKEHTNECIKKAIDSLEEKYGSKFKKIFKSMTTDNGHEFLNYDKIEISKLWSDRRENYNNINIFSGNPTVRENWRGNGETYEQNSI